jgi:hypothetical protein
MQVENIPFPFPEIPCYSLFLQRTGNSIQAIDTMNLKSRFATELSLKTGKFRNFPVFRETSSSGGAADDVFGSSTLREPANGIPHRHPGPRSAVGDRVAPVSEFLEDFGGAAHAN